MMGSTSSLLRLFIAAIILTACSNPHTSEKVQINIEQLADTDPAFAAMNAGKQADEEPTLPAGTKLLAVVSNECPSAQKNSDLQLGDLRRMRLHKQAYSMTLKKEMSLSELNKQAADDDCLLEVANTSRLYASAVSNDPGFSAQRHLASIEAPAAYDILAAPGALTQDVVVAVIDTGVDLNHQDLKANLWNDGAGNAGYDFVNDDTTPSDDVGHGTHVAGLAAAVTNNAVGVAGVAINKAKIMALKVLNAEGSGSDVDIVNAIRFAIEKKVDVINMSLGGPGRSPGIQSAMKEASAAGITLIMAAGNEGRNVGPSYIVSPAFYAKDISGAVAIASIDSVSKRLSSFSNFSPTYVELAAPGSNGLVSTYLGNTYASMQGTSMASPVAAGAAAITASWLKSHKYPVTPGLVKSILISSAETNSNIVNQVNGGHGLNLRQVASYLQTHYPAGGLPAPTPTPTVTPTPTPAPVVSPSPPPQATPKERRFDHRRRHR